jgi:hypothetical protein
MAKGAYNVSIMCHKPSGQKGELNVKTIGKDLLTPGVRSLLNCSTNLSLCVQEGVQFIPYCLERNSDSRAQNRFLLFVADITSINGLS